MIGMFKFYKECKANGVKPIIGEEFYFGEQSTTDKFHIILIAKNETGLKNLYELSYKAYTNFYGKPRLNSKMITEHSEGLICLTACIGGELYKTFKEKTDVQYVTWLKGLFDSDLYLEIQSNKLEEQRRFNIRIKELCEITKTSPVVTCDAHYVNKEDYVSHDTLLCLQTNKLKPDPKRFKFTSNDFYMKSDDEILSELDYLGESFVQFSIDNTRYIADCCDVSIKTGQNLLPESINIQNPDLHLAKMCNEGFKWRMKQGHYNGIDINEVVERIKYEIRVIKEKGYSSYFIIMEDIIRFCEKNNIPYGVGRGSVCGSELAFILGLTEIEPIRYGLYFERFLNPTRNSAPDIDSDLCYERRGEVIEYIKDRYGEENTAHIIAEGRYTLKAVIREVLRIYGYNKREQDSVCKLIPDFVKTIEEAVKKSKDLFNVLLKYPKEFKDMAFLEGLIKNKSTHAAGIIIAPTKITDYVPCLIDDGMTVSQWDKKVVEEIGLYKFDMLGLKLLTIYDMTRKWILKNHGINITREILFSHDVENPKIYEVLKKGLYKGLFQFDAPSAKPIVQQIQPNCFEDIVAGESICRPGVKEAQLYISNVKSFRESGEYFVPSYWNKVKHILEQTYGAIVYQEQTMLLFADIGGFTLGEADALRKVKSLEPYRERFVTGALTKGFTYEEATELFDRFDLSYAFNKSHACAYGKNTTSGMWYKTYYYKEFMASAMTIELTRQEPDIKGFVAECRGYGEKILPPDINDSTKQWIPLIEGILTPLICIDGVGDKCVEEILKHRPYSSFEDFITRVPKSKVKKNNIIALIKAGAFDKFNPNRTMLIENFLKSRKESVPVMPFWCDELRYVYEGETLGFYCSKHPLDGFINNNIAEYKDGETMVVNCIIDEVKLHTDKNGNEMAFVKCSNLVCSFDVTVFARTFAKYKGYIVKNRRVSISGKLNGGLLANTFQNI